MKNRLLFFAALPGLVIAAACLPAPLVAQSGAVAEHSPKSSARVCRCGGWFVAESPGFWVCCCNQELPAAKIAQHCENLHQQLCEKWFAAKAPTSWSPKCMVVLHPSLESYLAAVGREAASTAGSSVVERLKQRITKRRIDLRGDRADYLTAALPHELTHVILADHFSAKSLPRWADEGMAVLADTQAKRNLNLRDLHAARARGTVFRLTELLPLHEYPSPDRWDAFYGQSMSVVDYLASRGTPQQFVQFLDAAKAVGYDRALRNRYGIRDMQELDRLWNSSLVDSPAMLATDP